MPGISLKTRFNRAKKMSIVKWNEKAGIAEEEFKKAIILLNDGCSARLKGKSLLGLSEQDCGFCKYYDCYGCPMDNEKGKVYCCREWTAAFNAATNYDYPDYHAAAIALRDRIQGMEYEEENND